MEDFQFQKINYSQNELNDQQISPLIYYNYEQIYNQYEGRGYQYLTALYDFYSDISEFSNVQQEVNALKDQLIRFYIYPTILNLNSDLLDGELQVMPLNIEQHIQRVENQEPRIIYDGENLEEPSIQGGFPLRYEDLESYQGEEEEDMTRIWYEGQPQRRPDPNEIFEMEDEVNEMALQNFQLVNDRIHFQVIPYNRAPIFLNKNEILRNNLGDNQDYIERVNDRDFHYENYVMKIDFDQILKKLLDQQDSTIFQEIWYRQYDQQQFSQIIYGQNAVWKRYLEKIFNHQRSSDQYDLTFRNQEGSMILAPSIQKLQKESKIIEIIIPGFSFLNLPRDSASKQEIEIQFDQLIEKHNELYPFQAPDEIEEKYHISENRKTRIFKQLQKNFKQLKFFIEMLIQFVGYNRRFDRIWFSCDIHGYDNEMNPQSKTVAQAYGVPPSDVREEGYDHQLNVLSTQQQTQFIENIVTKLTINAFDYKFTPFYIQNIQIFLSQNPQFNDNNIQKNLYQNKILQGDNFRQSQIIDLLEKISELRTFSKKQVKKHSKKKQQYIINMCSSFKQNPGEPCLFTVYRFLVNSELVWSQVQNQLPKKLQRFIRKGMFSNFMKYMYKNKQLLEDFGIFFYNSYRWVNQNASVQYVILDKHIFISNQQKIESFVYTQVRNKKERFVLKPSICKQKYSKKKQTELDKIELFFDIESYNDKEGKNIPYLLCFYNHQLKKFKNFWGDKCLFKALKWLKRIQKRYDEIKIWSFNGSRYDYPLLWKKMVYLNIDSQIYGTHNNIKSLIWNNIKFVDIKLIFTRGSLKQQCKSWGLSENKLDFDIGGKSKKFFEQFKKLIIVYCMQDCRTLALLVQKYYELCQKVQYNNKKLQYHNIFTASQLSIEIYQQLYQKISISGSGSWEIYEIEKSSYFGGMTQVFKKVAINFFYYDINSSYPYVLKTFDFPYQFISKSKYKNNDEIKDYNLYLVEIIFHDDCLIPFIPQRGKDGLYYTKIIKKSWRWGVDINFGIKHKLFQTYHIYEEIKYLATNLFSNFIEDMYQQRLIAKQNKQDDMSEFCKLVMNSLYGKTGQNINSERKYCRQQNLSEFINDFPLIQMKNNQRKFLNKQSDLLIKEIQSLRRLDNKVFQLEYLPEKKINTISSLVRIAALTTRYAARQLYEGMLDVGLENVIYCDTDSIMTTKPLSNYLQNEDTLGKWKLEKDCLIKRGYFAAPKLYYLQRWNDSFDFKSKGIMNQFSWICNGEKIKMNTFSKTDMEKFQKLITDLIFSQQQQILIENDKQFIKKNLDIYVIPLKKVITVQNKKRKFNGILSKPLDYIPEDSILTSAY